MISNTSDNQVPPISTNLTLFKSIPRTISAPLRTILSRNCMNCPYHSSSSQYTSSQKGIVSRRYRDKQIYLSLTASIYFQDYNSLQTLQLNDFPSIMPLREVTAECAAGLEAATRMIYNCGEKLFTTEELTKAYAYMKAKDQVRMGYVVHRYLSWRLK